MATGEDDGQTQTGAGRGRESGPRGRGPGLLPILVTAVLVAFAGTALYLWLAAGRMPAVDLADLEKMEELDEATESDEAAEREVAAEAKEAIGQEETAGREEPAGTAEAGPSKDSLTGEPPALLAPPGTNGPDAPPAEEPPRQEPPAGPSEPDSERRPPPEPPRLPVTSSAESDVNPEPVSAEPGPAPPGETVDTAGPDRESSNDLSGAVPYVAPGPNWDRFLILVWQYKTDVRKDLPLYRRVNLFGFHIDRGAGRKDLVAFAKANALPYYVDHAADKGILHLTDRTGKDTVLRKRNVVARPHSLADPRTIDLLKGHLRRNITATREGPVVAYAFDDEVSLGSFNSPAEVDGSPLSVAGYRRWLGRQYGTVDELNRAWGTSHRGFETVRPISFEEVRQRHTSPPILEWNLAPWMDWRSYMDSQFADCLAALTRYANSLDPQTPGGIVGGQQPAPYGGFDYAKICRALQWIEAYDIGGTCEIIRSLWATGPERRPYVQTWFSTGDASRDAWFLWYYLLHGNRGVIAWPDMDGSWFHHKGGGIADFLLQNADTMREVQGDLSRAILDPGARFDADPVALYYSHPSVQATWAMDSVTHGGSWPNRSSSLDNKCQSAGKNRVAWTKLLEDCGFQYNIVTPRQVEEGRLLDDGYKVLVMDRTVAMSDAEAKAVRGFVEAGGTVIADHLTGLLTEHGVGRREAGTMDGLFGIQRDERKGYLDGKHVTEIDGELHDKPFLERLKYEGALRYKGIVVYERGTRARGGKAEAAVGGASVVVRNRVGKGRSVYLNLAPTAYYDMNARLSAYGAVWRKLLTDILAESGLEPRARVLSRGRPVPMAEVVYWRRGDRLVVGIVKNPARQGSITGVGEVHGVTGRPVNVEIVFRERARNVVDLRTGRKLRAGSTIRARWKPWEALVFEMSLPRDR